MRTVSTEPCRTIDGSIEMRVQRCQHGKESMQRHEAKCEEGLEEFPDWDVRNGFDFRPRVFLFESSSQNRWNVKGRVKDSPEKECPVCAVPQSAD